MNDIDKWTANAIDKWTAKQCGIEPDLVEGISGISKGKFYQRNQFKHKGEWNSYRWTIEDPRCREIVREHFKLTTYYIKLNSGKNWTCQLDKKTYGRGKTIAEAELAAITSIYEASQ